MYYFIVAVVVFIVTSLWHHWALKKQRMALRVCLQGMMNELNTLTQICGYKDVTDYWTKTKGEDYSNIALQNYNGAIEVLK